MSERKHIAVVTTSRADFSHLVWPLACIRDDDRLALSIVETGAHLSREFGHTGREIRDAGFEVSRSIECLISSDTDVGMAKTIAVAAMGLADTLSELRPDILLLIADRFEMLAPASVALALRIPMAHIEGGEISEGAVDDAVRNALTKMAHLHFTPHADASRRVLAMGEERWRVHQVGAPSLDHLRRSTLADRGSLARRLDLDTSKPLCVACVHPVTLLADTIGEADAVFDALDGVDAQIAFCFPNADAGSRALIERAQTFCADRDSAHLYVNLDPVTYWSLLAMADAMVGNSSSGIMETPALSLPTVNVGLRQRGRMRAKNIVDVPADAPAIRAAVDHALAPDTRQALGTVANPYGDGHAGERIARALAEAPGREALLFKRALPLADGLAFDHDTVPAP